MEESRLGKFISISLFVAVLSIIFFHSIKITLDNASFKDKYVLIIGILSSPDNFQKRSSIRNTWLKLTSDISVAYYFVIGEQFCHIHPLDRISVYSCDENLMSLPKNATTEFTTMRKIHDGNLSLSSKLNYAGFGFETLDDIIIEKLGVITNFLNHIKSDVTVKLISSDSKAVLASVTIAYNELTTVNTDFVLLPIRGLGLKRGSEAQLLVDLIPKNTSYFVNCDNFEWDVTPGVINYLQLIQTGIWKPWPFQMNSCSYVLMNYKIADFESFKVHAEEKELRAREWENIQANVTLQVKSESKHFGDILFVNVMDIYRNLPQKVVKFFQRVTDTVNFDCVLKTDDDTFIDVLRVFRQVSTMKDSHTKISDSSNNSHWMDTTENTSQFWWWSDFREFWKVQESGKWREDKYRSPAYPSFPCGGGYVLSRGIVSYLSENSKNLQYFQGEDVSIGIWLSGLKTVQYTTYNPKHNYSWIQKDVIRKYGGEDAWFKFKKSTQNSLIGDICDWTCHHEIDLHHIPLCNRVQLDSSEMYKVWNDYVQNGFIH